MAKKHKNAPPNTKKKLHRWRLKKEEERRSQGKEEAAMQAEWDKEWRAIERAREGCGERVGVRKEEARRLPSPG